MPAEARVGRVFVEVSPKAAPNFNAQVKKIVAKVPKQTIAIDVDTSLAERKLERLARTRYVRYIALADTREAEKTLRDLSKNQKIKVGVEIDQANLPNFGDKGFTVHANFDVDKEWAWLRDRRMDIDAKMNVDREHFRKQLRDLNRDIHEQLKIQLRFFGAGSAIRTVWADVLAAAALMPPIPLRFIADTNAIKDATKAKHVIETEFKRDPIDLAARVSAQEIKAKVKAATDRIEANLGVKVDPDKTTLGQFRTLNTQAEQIAKKNPVEIPVEPVIAKDAIRKVAEASGLTVHVTDGGTIEKNIAAPLDEQQKKWGSSLYIHAELEGMAKVYAELDRMQKKANLEIAFKNRGRVADQIKALQKPIPVEIDPTVSQHATERLRDNVYSELERLSKQAKLDIEAGLNVSVPSVKQALDEIQTEARKRWMEMRVRANADLMYRDFDVIRNRMENEELGIHVVDNGTIEENIARPLELLQKEWGSSLKIHTILDASYEFVKRQLAKLSPQTVEVDVDTSSASTSLEELYQKNAVLFEALKKKYKIEVDNKNAMRNLIEAEREVKRVHEELRVFELWVEVSKTSLALAKAKIKEFTTFLSTSIKERHKFKIDVDTEKLKEGRKAVSGMFSALSGGGKIVSAVTGAIGDFIEGIGAIIDGIRGFMTIARSFFDIIKSITTQIRGMAEAAAGAEAGFGGLIAALGEAAASMGISVIITAVAVALMSMATALSLGTTAALAFIAAAVVTAAVISALALAAGALASALVVIPGLITGILGPLGILMIALKPVVKLFQEWMTLQDTIENSKITETLKLAADAANKLKGAADGAKESVSAADSATAEWQAKFDKLPKAAQDLVKTLQEGYAVFKNISDLIQKASLPGVNELLKSVIAIFGTMKNGEFIPTALTNQLLSFAGVVSDVAKQIGDMLKQPGVQENLTSLIESMKLAFQSLSAAGISSVVTILGTVARVAESARPAVDALARGFSSLAPVIDQFFTTISRKDVMDAIIAGMNAFFQLIIEIVPIIGTLVAELTKVGSDTLNKLVGALVSIFSALAKIITDLATSGMMNGFIELIVQVGNALTELAKPGKDGESIFTKLGDAFGKVMTALAPLLPQLIEQLVPMLPSLIKSFTDLTLEFIKMLPTLIEMTPQFIELAKLVLELATVSLPLLTLMFNMMKPAIEVILIILKDFVDRLDLIIKTAQKVWDYLFGNSIFPDLEKAFKNWVENVKKIFRDFGKDIQKVFTDIKNWIVEKFNQIWAFIQLVWSLVKQSVASVYQYIVNVFQNVKDWIVGKFNEIWGFINLVWNLVKQSVYNVYQTIVIIFQSVKDWIVGKFNEVWGFIWYVFSLIKNAASDAGRWLSDRFTDAKNWIVDRFNDLIGFIWGLPGRIAQAASGMWDGIKEAFKSVMNWIIGKWNDFHLEVDIPDMIPGLPDSITIDTPNIPFLAKGGIARTPTLAIVGEAGPEAVIPLDQLSMFMTKFSNLLPTATEQSKEKNVTLNYNVYNPLPEPASRSIPKDMRRLSSVLG